MSKSYSTYKRASSWLSVFKDSSISVIYSGKVLKQQQKQSNKKQTYCAGFAHD